MRIASKEGSWFVEDELRNAVVNVNKKDLLHRAKIYAFGRVPWSTIIRSMRLWINILKQCKLDDETKHILTEALRKGQKRLQTIRTHDEENCPYYQFGHCKLSDYVQPFRVLRRCSVRSCPFRVFSLEDLLKIRIP